jgi:SAM-dependent methyltransferase
MQQRFLTAEQIQAFYHDEFVEDQTRDFIQLVPHDLGEGAVVVDVGGGCGFFAESIARAAGRQVRVIDSDPRSVGACIQRNVPAACGDALAPAISGDEQVACFNLILHHLVGASGRQTRELQRQALRAWQAQVRLVFVNEYIYESFLGGLSGALIYWITSNRMLSRIGRSVARVVPAFRANTFGVGVRFRAHEEWVDQFRAAGYEVIGRKIGPPERISPPLRLLLIRQIRRDSFLLRPLQRPASVRPDTVANKALA